MYNFVKGKGWVLGPEVYSVESIFKDGSRVRFELRDPLPGEYFNHVRKHYALDGAEAFVRDCAVAAKDWCYLDYISKLPGDPEDYYFAVAVLL